MSDRQPDYAGYSEASDAERPGNLKVTFFRNTIHPNDYAEYVHTVFVLVFNSFFLLYALREWPRLAVLASITLLKLGRWSNCVCSNEVTMVNFEETRNTNQLE